MAKLHLSAERLAYSLWDTLKALVALTKALVALAVAPFYGVLNALWLLYRETQSPVEFFLGIRQMGPPEVALSMIRARRLTFPRSRIYEIALDVAER